MANSDSEKMASDQGHESYADDAKARRVLVVDSSGNVVKITRSRENLAGSAGTGSDGDTNRVYTLTTTNSVDIVEVFLALSKRDGDNWMEWKPPIKEDKYYELILNVLDHAGLIEHGTSIYGSWLSDKGDDVLKVLN